MLNVSLVFSKEMECDQVDAVLPAQLPYQELVAIQPPEQDILPPLSEELVELRPVQLPPSEQQENNAMVGIACNLVEHSLLLINAPDQSYSFQ